MNGTAASRYAALEAKRTHYITRAEKHARITIPSLFPEMGFGPTYDLYTPYQSVGARGVNNLASKLLLTLFPPNSSFFKLSVDELTIAQMTQQQGMKAQVDEGLATIERVVLNSVETSPLRTSVFEALKQLIVAGNVCFNVPSPEDIRVFRLNQYVVKRSPNGAVIEAVVVEEIDEVALPEPAKQASRSLTCSLWARHFLPTSSPRSRPMRAKSAPLQSIRSTRTSDWRTASTSSTRRSAARRSKAQTLL